MSADVVYVRCGVMLGSWVLGSGTVTARMSLRVCARFHCLGVFGAFLREEG
jgi:hypothetical protein